MKIIIVFFVICLTRSASCFSQPYLHGYFQNECAFVDSIHQRQQLKRPAVDHFYEFYVSVYIDACANISDFQVHEISPNKTPAEILKYMREFVFTTNGKWIEPVDTANVNGIQEIVLWVNFFKDRRKLNPAVYDGPNWEYLEYDFKHNSRVLNKFYSNDQGKFIMLIF